jgi:hypothetical protein
LDEIDNNNSEFRCQTKLLKMPDPRETIPPNFSNFDMAAKMHKKHKNKISGLVISMGYYE